MIGLPPIYGVFRLVDDPELRFTPAGHAVCNVRLVSNGRKFDRDKNEWVDDKVIFLSGSVWRQYAENVAESLRKGDHVFIMGTLETRSYETQEGEKRQVYEVLIDEIGPTLRFRQVLHSDASGNKVTREGAERSSTVDHNDPWDTPPPDDSPPF